MARYHDGCAAGGCHPGITEPMALCAVVVTHARAPLWTHLITVPFIVTTDNAAAVRRGLWGGEIH